MSIHSRHVQRKCTGSFECFLKCQIFHNRLLSVTSHSRDKVCSFLQCLCTLLWPFQDLFYWEQFIQGYSNVSSCKFEFLLG